MTKRFEHLWHLQTCPRGTVQFLLSASCECPQCGHFQRTGVPSVLAMPHSIRNPQIYIRGSVADSTRRLATKSPRCRFAIAILAPHCRQRSHVNIQPITGHVLAGGLEGNHIWLGKPSLVMCSATTYCATTGACRVAEAGKLVFVQHELMVEQAKSCWWG